MDKALTKRHEPAVRELVADFNRRALTANVGLGEINVEDVVREWRLRRAGGAAH